MRTVLSQDRVESIKVLAETTRNISGPIVDVGTYEGGVAELLARRFPDKKVYAFDTFCGAPKSKTDNIIDMHKSGDFMPGDPARVMKELRQISNVAVVQGIFPECAETELNDISFVHLDVDLFQSTKESLEWLWPRMAPGGIIVIDDWEWEPCKGVQRAACEFFYEKSIPISISPLTEDKQIKQAFVVKPGCRTPAEVHQSDSEASGIMFLTLFDDGMRDVGTFSIDTAQAYCKKYGYSLFWRASMVDPTLAPSWNKVLLLSEFANTQPEGQWLWWFDADSLFVDCDTNAWEYLSKVKPGADFVFGKDWNGLCCGTMAVRNTQFARDILSTLPRLGDVGDPNKYGEGLGCKWEQNAFKALVEAFPSFAAKVDFFPESLINDHPERTMKEEGQFFLHFPCRDNVERIKGMKKWKMAVALDNEETS